MKKLSIFLVILCMGFIFYNSSNTGLESNVKSYEILNKLKSEKHVIENRTAVNPVKGTENEKIPSSKRDQKINLIIRKNAHAFEFMILAILVAAVLSSFNLTGKNALVYIMFICLFSAVMDEFHQIFVPGRTSSVIDVLIDFVGSLIGIAIFTCIDKLLKSRKMHTLKYKDK